MASMFKRSSLHSSATPLVAVVACGALLLTSGCASDDPGDGASPTATDTVASVDTTAASTTSTGSTAAPDSIAPDATATDGTTGSESTDVVDSAAGTECEDIAALFATRGSANADLDDPEVSASCDAGNVIVTSNGIPDYPYVETSPGQPRDQDNTFTIPATPVVADTTTDVARLGTIAVTLGGIQIFGPTEGTGGDVESLPGILSDCGSHNGPSGFHIHLILTSPETDCLFTPEEVGAEPQLVGYAFDGFPIYTGADQYTSSWQLTDESLFATDTWAAHTYVDGSGDLDQCNGRTDADGNYAYFTTATFPYVLGCYTGVVDLDAARGDVAGGDRPERPEGDADASGDRPARPEEDAGAAAPGGRPARPEPAAAGATSPEGGADG